MYRGLLKYFPKALAAVSYVSWVGNEQHNPGQELHWAREKSTDQFDCIIRHLVDDLEDAADSDGTSHLAKAAWRCLAALEIRIEEQLKLVRSLNEVERDYNVYDEEWPYVPRADTDKDKH